MTGFWATIIVIGNSYVGIYFDHGTQPTSYRACIRAIPALQERAQRDPAVLARPGIMAMVGTCSRKTPQQQQDALTALLPLQGGI